MKGTTPPSEITPAEIRVYISDMLSQLADLARGTGDRRLETSMRLLAQGVMPKLRNYCSTKLAAE